MAFLQCSYGLQLNTAWVEHSYKVSEHGFRSTHLVSSTRNSIQHVLDRKHGPCDPHVLNSMLNPFQIESVPV